jgi:mannose-6-phosphate isomerase class I
MDSPLSVDENGINFKPEKMEKEKLYHCIFKNKAMLGFKDSQDVLNCYEVEDANLVEKIQQCIDSDDLEKFFDIYLKEQNLKN